MTALPPDIERFAAFVRACKETVVADPQPDRYGSATGDDLPPIVEGRRAGRMVAMAMAPLLDRDMGLTAAKVIADTFAADELWFATDAHVSHQADNPLTGRPWEPGEMQRACDDAGACQLGLITDCMMINRVDRNHVHTMAVLPYHVHHAERTIRWVDDRVAVMSSKDEGAEVSGLIVDELDVAMNLGPRPQAQRYGEAFLRSRGYTVWVEPSLDDAAAAVGLGRR